MTVVIDASVAMKWLVAGEGSDRALALIGSDTLVAPDLIFAEAANALWRYSSGGFLAAEAGEAALAALQRTLDRTYPLAPMASEAYSLAAVLAHPAYDCFYLSLARSLNCLLWTADKRLVAKLGGTELQDRVRLL
jgi:predicted nucleic acid-binding protein